MTHRELCEIGSKWLKDIKQWRFRCQFVLTEFVSICSERPDIFGLKGGSMTILIEVKVSKSDYWADFKKDHRFLGKGIGAERYYLCPTGLIDVSELPNNWGLLYCDNNKLITVVKESGNFDRNLMHEMDIFYSLIRRLAKKPQVFDFRKKNNL